MRIDPGSQGGPVRGRKIGRLIQGSSATPSARSEEPSESESVLSSETAALLAALRNVPDVRPEVIEDVRRRLSKGEFLSREAAEKTAEAILADLASFIGQ